MPEREGGAEVADEAPSRVVLPAGCWVNRDGWVSLPGGEALGVLWPNWDSAIARWKAEREARP